MASRLESEKSSLLVTDDEQYKANDSDPSPSSPHLKAKFPNHEQAWPRTIRGRIYAFIHRLTLNLATLLFGILIFTTLYGTRYALLHPSTSPSSIYSSTRKIPLEAHIMSKCPDAKDCLKDLIVPAMEKISDIVDFQLSYIGRTSKEDDGVECMHGPPECLGNMLELCAMKLYPDPKISLGFTMCMTDDYENIPDKELVENCALEHGLSFEKLNECVSDERVGQGLDMLRKSVERSHEVNASKSCTVRVDGKQWCVRDGGKWKGCKNGTRPIDLVKYINGLRDGDDE